jgi:hypothetical protein
MDALYRTCRSYSRILISFKSRCLLRSVFVHRLQRNSRFCHFSCHIVVLRAGIAQSV